MKFNKETHSYMCDRCGKDTSSHITSWFNKEDICMECKEKEQKHPKYREAKEAVYEHEQMGDRDWEGIGLPEDLKVKNF